MYGLKGVLGGWAVSYGRGIPVGALVLGGQSQAYGRTRGRPFYGRACRWAMLGESKPKGPKGACPSSRVSQLAASQTALRVTPVISYSGPASGPRLQGHLARKKPPPPGTLE